MFIGVTIMLIYSFSPILSVGCADICVNLDAFEAYPEASSLCKTIASFSGNNSGGMNPIDIVNVCWTGSDLMEVFNSLRENMTDMINVDITKEFTLHELDSFITEINLLNIDGFGVEGDRLIDAFHNVDVGGFNAGFGCLCTCGSTHGDSNAMFTRDTLKSGTLGCWKPGFGSGSDSAVAANTFQACIGNFTAAFTYVHAENTNELMPVILKIKLLKLLVLRSVLKNL